MRTGTYLKAIMRNKHLFKGKVNIKLVRFILFYTITTISSRLSWMLAVALASSPYLLLKQELLRLAFVTFLHNEILIPGDWG